jgi:hypothetical protein
MLTDKGFSHVTLYTGDGTARAMTCKGLNGTRLVAAMPDFLTRARSFAMSAEGELVGLLLLGEKRITSCRCDLQPFHTARNATHMPRQTSVCEIRVDKK